MILFGETHESRCVRVLSQSFQFQINGFHCHDFLFITFLKSQRRNATAHNQKNQEYRTIHHSLFLVRTYTNIHTWKICSISGELLKKDKHDDVVARLFFCVHPDIWFRSINRMNLCKFGICKYKHLLKANNPIFSSFFLFFACIFSANE